MGGVGGWHALTLARLGVGGFRLADADTFSVVNFNRQAGARVPTLGRNKARVVAEMIQEINPTARVWVLEEMVGPDNLASLLDGAALALDGIDFFGLPARRLLFQRARAAGIWAFTAGPLGCSAALVCFSPHGMSFDEYCGLHDGLGPEEQLMAFMVALAPRATQRTYLDLGQVDLRSGAGPSTGLACQLAGSLVGAASLRVLTGREPPAAAPWFSQWDAYLGVLRRGRLRGGGRGPLQRLKRHLLRRYLVRRGVLPAPGGSAG
jgi:molybdopterin/thiamine biosynthesis adenylyltransferase